MFLRSPDAAQRVALAKRCAAEPGSLRTPAFGTIPVLRSSATRCVAPGKPSLSLRSPDAAQRVALAKRCAAEPGPLRTPALGTVPVLRSGMKNAAPRPGHAS